MEFYLASTSHLEDRLWFRNEEDFKVGMNYVAVVAHATGTPVLAFILMSNHVHFVLQGSCSESKAFVASFKQRYSAYLRRQYGIKEMLRANGVDLSPIEMEGESLERAIAYVLMNSVAANICIHPGQYPWGSGNIIFNRQTASGRTLSSLSLRAQIRILHSRAILPGTLILSDSGYILPESYISLSFLESLFRSPKRLQWFLLSSSKAKARLSRADSALPSFRDQSLYAAIPDLCISLFRRNSPQELDEEQKGELIRQLRRRFSADPAQIARVAGIPYEKVADLLESF